MTASVLRHPARRSWIPWIFVGGFLAVAAVNGVMIYFAAHSATPLVTDHPYERGIAYNAVLQRGAAQDALGWSGALRFEPSGGGARGEIVVTIAGRDGGALRELGVAARVYRPIEAGPSIELTLAPRGDGSYAAGLELPMAGQWQVEVTARRGADVYAFGHRIVVR